MPERPSAPLRARACRGGIGLGDRLYLRDRIVAALACLQPGIDPVFLVLLSLNAPVPSDDHGLIVGASQFGMMLGAVLYWRAPGRIGGPASRMMAVLALAACLATPLTASVMALVALRGMHGLCMGVLFTHTMSRASAHCPSHAYGTMFLFQLLLSSVCAALLPYLAGEVGAAAALAALALVPGVILALQVTERPAIGAASVPSPLPDADARHAVPVASLAATGALFLFICANMMIWSYVGAAATAAGLAEEAIGWGIAIGSLSGALVALTASYLRRRVPLLIGGAASAIATVSPLAIAPGIGAWGFLALMILFNLGTTYSVIRCSAQAILLDPTATTRRTVSAMNPIAMMAGPLIGFASVKLQGSSGLAAMSIFAALLGLLALAASCLGEARAAGPVEAANGA